jgi:beta-N-acetylhexosaminidase
MPPDPQAAINAVVAAVQSNRITRKRLDESVMRLLVAKAHVGLGVKKLVDIDNIHDVVNSPESAAVAQQIADRSVTLVKNSGDFLPFKAAPASTAFFLLSESRTGVEGQAFLQELRRRSSSSMVIQLDSSMSDADIQAGLDRAQGAQRYVVAAFASLAVYRGNAALGGGFPKLMDDLIATQKPVLLMALGNPYLLRNFPGVSTYLTTCSSVPVSEIAAVKALFGEIAIGGKLPVSIPGFAKYGDGIELPAIKSQTN